MKVGGFQKQSLIDWEGKICAVIFTKGCNFRCSYCHNPELVYPELFDITPNIEIEYILNYLFSRKNWLDGVVITGGEPTIQSNLKQFIEDIKNIGYAVKLDTNGAKPEVLHDLISSKLIDFVAMDIKTILEKEVYQNICGIKDESLITKIQESLNILRNSGIDFVLRTTVVPHFHSEGIIENLKTTFSNCKYQLQTYRSTSLINSNKVTQGVLHST